MRLLLVEDNAELAEWVARLLRKSHYVVDFVHDGHEAEAALASQGYDLVILDLELPGQSGLVVLRWLRARRDATPVIILTANDAISSRIAGLDSGADDYLVKPFDPGELEARIRALMRRKSPTMAEPAQFGPLAFDPAKRHFTLRNAALDLTGREFAVLETLVLAQGRIVSKAALVEAVFGFDDDVGPNAIEIYVHRVRKRLQGSGIGIGTQRGLGYALREAHD